MRLITKRIISDPDGHPYLIRWKMPLPLGFAIYLHKMVQPDYARDMHDHPFPFVTIVLRGGYMERYLATVLARYVSVNMGSGRRRRLARSGSVQLPTTRWNAPGRIRFNPANHAHVITELPNGTCWTLVLRGRRWREWGFHTICGWMHWRKYTDRVYRGDPVCEDESQ